MSEGDPVGPGGQAGAVRHRIVASPPAISLKPGVGETEVDVFRRYARGVREGLVRSVKRRARGGT